MCVIMLTSTVFSPLEMHWRGEVTYIGFARAATNLRKKQVNAKRRIWVPQVLLYGLDL